MLRRLCLVHLVDRFDSELKGGSAVLARFVFKVSAFHLDTRAQTGAPLSDCRINNTLVKSQ